MSRQLSELLSHPRISSVEIGTMLPVLRDGNDAFAQANDTHGRMILHCRAATHEEAVVRLHRALILDVAWQQWRDGAEDPQVATPEDLLKSANEIHHALAGFRIGLLTAIRTKKVDG
jgi:hypothetical protein